MSEIYEKPESCYCHHGNVPCSFCTDANYCEECNKNTWDDECLDCGAILVEEAKESKGSNSKIRIMTKAEMALKYTRPSEKNWRFLAGWAEKNDNLLGMVLGDYDSSQIKNTGYTYVKGVYVSKTHVIKVSWRFKTKEEFIKEYKHLVDWRLMGGRKGHVWPTGMDYLFGKQIADRQAEKINTGGLKWRSYSRGGWHITGSMITDRPLPETAKPEEAERIYMFKTREKAEEYSKIHLHSVGMDSDGEVSSAIIGVDWGKSKEPVKAETEVDKWCKETIEEIDKQPITPLYSEIQRNEEMLKDTRDILSEYKQSINPNAEKTLETLDKLYKRRDKLMGKEE